MEYDKSKVMISGANQKINEKSNFEYDSSKVLISSQKDPEYVRNQQLLKEAVDFVNSGGLLSYSKYDKDKKQDLRALVASKKDEILYQERVDSYNKVIDAALSLEQNGEVIEQLNLLKEEVNNIGQIYKKNELYKTNYKNSQLYKENQKLSSGISLYGHQIDEYNNILRDSINAASSKEEKGYIYTQTLNSFIKMIDSGKELSKLEMAHFAEIAEDARRYDIPDLIVNYYLASIFLPYYGKDVYYDSKYGLYFENSEFRKMLNGFIDAASNTDNKEIIAWADEAKKYMSDVDEETTFTSSRSIIYEKLSKGKALTFEECEQLKKYGAYHSRYLLKDGTAFDLDTFTLPDNPTFKKYRETYNKILSKLDNGEKLTSEEWQIKYTVEALENVNKQLLGELTNDIYNNRKWVNNIKALGLINDALYGYNGNKLAQTMDKTKIYAGTGLSNYFDGVANTVKVISGVDAQKIANQSQNEYQIASQYLSQYFTDNHQNIQKIYQDVVTNIAENVIPVLSARIGATKLAAPFGTEKAILKFLLKNSGQFLMGISTFGNAYKEAAQLGVTDNGKLWNYAIAVTASEVYLEKLLGSTFDAAGGKFVKSAAEKITASIKNVVLKGALKTITKGTGEFLEESIQSLLSPIFQKYILELQDTQTVFDSPVEQLKGAAYDGFIGFLTYVFTQGLSNFHEAATENALIDKGKNFKDTLNHIDVKTSDIAEYLKTISGNATLAKLAQQVLDGDTSDLTIGMLINEADGYSESCSNAIFVKLGEKIFETNNGVKTLFETYETVVEKGALYPEHVTSLYETVKNKYLKGDIDMISLGKFAYYVDATMPRAVMLGEIYKTSIQNGQKTKTDTTSDSERNLNAALSAVTGQKTPLHQSANGDIIDSRGEGNGEKRVLRDGSKRVRRKSGNPTSQIGGVQETDGGIYGVGQESTGNFGSEQDLRNQGDIGLNELSNEQKENLKTTAIKNDDGTPKRVYHFTNNMDFETFGEGDVGFHFGSISQAQQRKENLKNVGKLDDEGRIIEAYLDIKNPVHVSSDIMVWQPSQTALRLWADGIITEEEYKTIYKMHNESGGGYNSSAAIELRKMLFEKDYDGIIYQNSDFFEGEGESYIAFYPQQVITLNDGKNSNTAATSEDGAAFSMPENEVEGDYPTEGNTNPTQTSQEPQDEYPKNESGLENIEDGADEDRAVFREPSEKEIYREPSSDEKVAAMLGKMKSTVQRQVEAVAGDFGIKMIWSEKITVDDGIYDPVNRTITLNPNTTLSDAYIFLFKHEFVHSLEIKKGYVGYKDYLYKSSIAFEEYIRNELKESFGVDFEGTRQEVIDKYVEVYWDKRQNAKTIPKSIRDAYTRESIEREIVSDFVADNLLGAKDGVQDFSKVEAALSEMANTHRNIFQKIIDFIKDWITKLKGAPQNRTLVEDLEYLNRRLMRVYDSPTNKKAANDSGVKHSFKNTKNGLSNDLLLHYDAELTNLIEQRGDYIIDSLDKLKNVVDIAFNNPKQKSTAYFGIIPAEILSKIENSIPNIPKELNGALFKGGKTYSVAATLDSIQHLADEKSLTREDIVEYLDKMADTIVNFDTVNFDYYYQGNQKSKGIIFKKKFKDGTIQSFEIVSSKKRTLNLQTIYMENGDYQKKKSAETLLMEKPSADAQGAGRSDSNISIPIKEKTVKNNISEESKNHSDNTENLSATEQHAVRKRRVKIENPQSFAKKLLRRNRSSQDAQTVERQIQSVVDSINESDYATAMRTAIETAKGILDFSKDMSVLSDEAQEVLNMIKGTEVSLNPTQKSETANAYGTYNDFRKRNMGRINIKNDATSLDRIWQGWAEEYPNIFDHEISDADMPVALANIIDTLKNSYVEFDENAAAEHLASQIFTECVNNRQKSINNQFLDAVDAANKNFDSEKKEYNKKLNQQEKRLKRQGEQLKQRRQEVYDAVYAAREERATKQKNIEYIRREVRRMDTAFRTNSDKKNVPENLKEAIGHFIKIFAENDRSPFDKRDIASIQMAYSGLEGEYTKTGETLLDSYDFDIANNLRLLAGRLDGKTLREASYGDLILIRDIVDNFKFMLSNEKKMFIAGKDFDSDQIGASAMREVSGHNAKRNNFVVKATDNVAYSNMTPVYFFERLGDTFLKLFNDIQNGQDKWFVNMETAKTYIADTKEKYNYSKWQSETFKFTTVNGDDIELTVEQAMLLYATAKREYGNKEQMSEHLFRGGIVIETSGAKISELVANFKKKGADKKKVTESFAKEINSRAHQITPYDVGMVNEWLTAEQKGYADTMVDYLSKDMSELGNEVSLKLYGIRKYNEDYYIPYNSAQNFLYSQPGVTNDSRLKHQSFTHNTQVKANNPLVLSDFSSVCADHINRMCMYNALTVPLENMTRIFNYKTFGYEGKAPTDMKAEIERVYGKGAVEYISQFLTDMNGNVRNSTADKTINKLIGKFKKGAVFASASVVIQQPSAIMRAMAYVNPKYFLSTTFKISERDYQQLVQYAPVAGIKEMGRFDTGVGVANANWLLNQTPRGVKEKTKALLDLKDSTYRDDKFSYFAAKADEITWAHIWAAVKAEVADKVPDLKPGSEEFLKLAGERFTQVINRTQVYDSTLSRSQIMRDRSASAQMLTSFMSEGTVSLNMLMNAAHTAKNGGKKGKIFASRAIAAFAGSVVLNALLKSLVTAARDDDEEKTYLEKYIGHFVGNVTDDLFLPNMIPVVKDVVSIFKGYDVERADMSLFSDLADSIKMLDDENKSNEEKIESIASSVAAFLGLPAKNVIRDFKAVGNVFEDVLKNDKETDMVGIEYSIREELGIEDTITDKYEDLAEAALEDDEERYQAIYKYLIDAGYEERKIETGLKKAFSENTAVIEEAEDYISSLRKNKTYTSFSEDDQETLGKNIIDTMAKGKMIEQTVNNLDDYDKLYELKRKNPKTFEKEKEKVIASGVSEVQFNERLEYAKIKYMKSVGLDVHEYLMLKIATSKKYADTNKSGGVSASEKNAAVNRADVDSKAKQVYRQHNN